MNVPKNALKFLAPVLVAIIATPICMIWAMAAAGAGHGSFLPAIIMLPFTVLAGLAELNEKILIAIAAIQFPLYGIILGYANVRGRLITAAVALFTVHTLAVSYFFVAPFLYSLLPSERFEQAVRNNDVAAVTRMLDRGADPNYERPYSCNLLVLACIEENFEIAKLLIEHGADVNYQDKEYENHTPLFFALPHEQIIELLLAHGADVTLKDTTGATVLERAKGYRDFSLEQRGQMQYSAEKQARDERIIAMLEAATNKSTSRKPGPPTP